MSLIILLLRDICVVSVARLCIADVCTQYCHFTFQIALEDINFNEDEVAGSSDGSPSLHPLFESVY